MRTAAKLLLLVAGAALIIVAGFHTVSHMTDRTVFTVLVPGFVGGLILIGVSVRIDSARRSPASRE
jgi:hypothetical protein